MAIIFLAWSIFVLFSVGSLLLLHTYLVIVGKTTYEFLNERNDREKKRKALAMSLKATVSDNNSQENGLESKPTHAAGVTQPYVPVCTNEAAMVQCSSEVALFQRIQERISYTSGNCIKQCSINPFAGSSIFTGTTTTSSSTGSFTDTVSSHLDSICGKLRVCLYLLLPEVQNPNLTSLNLPMLTYLFSTQDTKLDPMWEKIEANDDESDDHHDDNDDNEP